MNECWGHRSSILLDRNDEFPPSVCCYFALFCFLFRFVLRHFVSWRFYPAVEEPVGRSVGSSSSSSSNDQMQLERITLPFPRSMGLACTKHGELICQYLVSVVLSIVVNATSWCVGNVSGDARKHYLSPIEERLDHLRFNDWLLAEEGGGDSPSSRPFRSGVIRNM